MLRIMQFKKNNVVNSEILKKISRIIFVVMVFSQIFFAASTFNWNPSFSFGIQWIDFVRIQAGFFVILFCLLTKKFTALEIKCFFFIIIFSFFFNQIRYFRWETIYILATAMVIRDEDDRWVVNSLFWLYLVNFVFVLSLTYFDVIESAVHYHDGILRSSLGFTHPNTTGAIILAIFIIYLLKKKENPSLYVLAAFVPAFVILNQRLGTRTGPIIIIFMLTCIIASKLFEKRGVSFDSLSKYRAILVNSLPFFLLFISYLLSSFFTAEILAIFIIYLFKKENPSLYVLIAFVPAFIILNQRLGTSAGLIAIASIFMLACIILKLFEKRGVKFDFLSNPRATFVTTLPFFFLVISYLLSYVFTVENGLFRFLDRLFNWRISSGHIFVHEYPITLWGVDVYQNIHDPESIYIHGYRFLDSGFLFSLLALGLVITAFRLLYFSWLGNEMMKRGYKYIPIILTGIFLFGFMEAFMWSPVWNVLFLFGVIFLKEYAMKKEGSDNLDS